MIPAAKTRDCRPRAYRGLALLLVALTALTACTGGDDGADRVTLLEGAIFGTFYQVTLPGERSEAESESLQAGIRERLDAVDAAMSTYRRDSELNRLNRTPVDEWMALSEALYRVLAMGLEASRETDGAFDVTVGGLVSLWGFGPEGRPRGVPPEVLINAHRALVGYHLLELDAERRAARRRADFFIDLSAIAKGHAIDDVGDYLDARGETRYLVTIGGDMLARGRRSDARPWRIGVERPDRDVAQAHHVLPLEDMAAATSGDYRNRFEDGGRRYSHIIDPRTGYPVEHRLASATVLHPSNTIANTWSTAMVVLGTDESLDLARRLDLKALLISRTDEGYRTHLSPALREHLGEDLAGQIRADDSAE